MSNTAVPIRPIAKGSLAKLWGGVALVAVIAGGLAWAGTAKAVGQSCSPSLMLPAEGGVSAIETTETGLMFQTKKAGQGESPTDQDIALINYKGTLANGTEFDANQNVPMPVAGSISGFSEALKMMQRGGSYRLCIPSALGYGAQEVGPIPANSVLVFDVDLQDFRSQAEVQMMQQMMQQQQGGAAPQADAMPQGQ